MFLIGLSYMRLHQHTCVVLMQSNMVSHAIKLVDLLLIILAGVLYFPAADSSAPFFDRIRDSISGNSLKQWNYEAGGENSALVAPTYCSFNGLTCDDYGDVIGIDISDWSLSGVFPDDICTYMPKLRYLSIGGNQFHGEFPVSIVNCSALEVLNASSNQFTGSLPLFSSLRLLRVLNLSYNQFSGSFPMTIVNLSSLELLDLNENPGFDMWELPEEISMLGKLRRLILSTCSIRGRIPASLGNMTWLEDLELSGNFLSGTIPATIGMMTNLRQLELYYNQLSGEIPIEFGNLTKLRDLDISVNMLTGTIPETLCRLPDLEILQLYNNSLTGEIPAALGDSTTLSLLSLYENFLTGPLPPNLGKFSTLIGVDISENKLSGPLPAEICGGGKLMYLLLLDNQFTGELPESYAHCTSILRFRVSKNYLSGKVPDQLWGLPHAAIIDLESNQFSGQISGNIQHAKNLSELYLARNMFSGPIPREISGAMSLIKLDLSKNQFSGVIPREIGELRSLNMVLMQENQFEGSIPDSLSMLNSANLLNLSNNQLNGTIPESICKLLPVSLDLSNNQLSGNIWSDIIRNGLSEYLSGNPGLCVSDHLENSNPVFPFCEAPVDNRKLSCAWVISVSIIIIFIGLLTLLKRHFRNDKKSLEDVSCSRKTWDIKSFHKLTFDEHEILGSLNDMNVIGHGGSGTVYKIQLSSGESVAVKKFWSTKTKNRISSGQYSYLDMELKAEVATLGKIRHKNIVKLYCCFTNCDSNLLVYEYMSNGNLWDALHQTEGKNVLDWPARHRIAMGIAQGLSYLHHDCSPPIVHRDIKTTNILLDAEFQAKVADFGVAKVLQAASIDSSTGSTTIAGTYGYLAPEYAYSVKPTVKCDVYSFGVVLMELISGRKPLEAEFGESKNIVYWVSRKAMSKEGASEILDKRIGDVYRDEMIQALRIAIRCTASLPVLRPEMNEVVQMLMEADPVIRFKTGKAAAGKIMSHNTNGKG